MAIPSPHLNNFDAAKKIEKYQNLILWTATILSLFGFVLNLETVQAGVQVQGWKEISDKFISVSGILVSALAIIYSVLEFIVQGYISEGSKKKRNDLIDNSFGSNLNAIKSDGYFSNSQVPDGIYKLAVNCFENSYFTATIVSKMLWKRWLTAGALTIAILLAAFSGSLNTLNTLIQLSITGVLLQQSIKLQWYYFKMNQIFQEFTNLFNSLKGVTDPEKRSPDILRNVLNYECTHAWGGVLNETAIYNQLNAELSQNWETMKQNLQIR